MWHTAESPLMLLYLQISFSLPQAHKSLPSDCGMFYVLFWYHLDWAERGLYCELTLERGGKKNPPDLIVTKKHWNVAGIWLQWWFVALVPGRGFRRRLIRSWWQKANVWGASRLHHCVHGEVVCTWKQSTVVNSVSLWNVWKSKQNTPVMYFSIIVGRSTKALYLCWLGLILYRSQWNFQAFYCHWFCWWFWRLPIV